MSVIDWLWRVARTCGVVGALAAMTVLASCGAGSGEASSSMSASGTLDPSWTSSQTPTPTPTPKPTPTPTPTPDPTPTEKASDVIADIEAQLVVLQPAVPQAEKMYNATLDRMVDGDTARVTLGNFVTSGHETLQQTLTLDGRPIRDLLQLRRNIETVLTGLRDYYALTIAGIAVTQTADGSNGRLLDSQLCEVPYDTKQRLLCGAVRDWIQLNSEFRAEFDTDIPIDVSYRTYEQQVVFKEVYADQPVATPGTSNHGTGIALDLPDYRPALNQPLGVDYTYGKPKYEWLVTHGPAHHWYTGRVAGEPWHLEWHPDGQ